MNMKTSVKKQVSRREIQWYIPCMHSVYLTKRKEKPSIKELNPIKINAKESFRE